MGTKQAGCEPAALLADHPTDCGQRPFSAYVHIPFCAKRCGYCDFNTYVTDFGAGANRATFADSIIAEIELAATTAVTADIPALDTIFFGGGTPTELPTSHLARIVAHLRERFSLQPNVEVSCEANPDSITSA
ncbi:MAG: coproporphyrinogen III oxidase, partial [Bowdeniella nasicola]|nr:coproporphyrinogen III oxidase [Bowdeniella nasicola]